MTLFRHALYPRTVAFLVLMSTWGCGEPDQSRPPPESPPVLGGPPPSLDGVEAGWRQLREVPAVDDALYLDGRWVLLDGAEGRLHLLEESRLPSVRSIGGRGDGPGELRGARLLAGDGDGFWVVSVDGRLDRFDASGAFRDRAVLLLEGCGLPDLREAVVLNGRLHMAAVCTLDRRRRFLLFTADEMGATRVLLDRPSATDGALTLHAPALASVGGRLGFGTGEGPCVSLLDGTGARAGADRCVAGPPIPMAPDIRTELEATVGRQARAAGIRLLIPEHLPWFDRLMPGGRGEILARRPVSAYGWRLERLGPEGGSWAVPPGVDVHGSNGRLLLAHHGADGVSVADVDAADIPWEGVAPVPSRDRTP